MSRFMQFFNFIGVLALAALCMIQWRSNRSANQEIDRLEAIRIQQWEKISEQDKTLKENAADLDDFRERLTISESALKDVRSRLAVSEADNSRLTTERDRLTVERDQLKSALDQWIAAVKVRDAALKKAADSIDEIATEKNDAIAKYNDLVGKYNVVVKDLTDTRAR